MKMNFDVNLIKKIKIQQEYSVKFIKLYDCCKTIMAAFYFEIKIHRL